MTTLTWARRDDAQNPMQAMQALSDGMHILLANVWRGVLNPGQLALLKELEYYAATNSLPFSAEALKAQALKNFENNTDYDDSWDDSGC